MSELSPLSEKRCIHCLQLIPEGAKRCFHCGSFQDLRRHVDIGNTSLALVVALIAVGGWASRPIIDYFKANNAPAVQISVEHISALAIRVLYTNKGSTIAFTDSSGLCIIPIARPNTPYRQEFEADLQALTRYDRLPRPDEIDHTHLVVYANDGGVRPLLPGEAMVIEYAFHQDRPTGSPVPQSVPGIPGLCSFGVKDAAGVPFTQIFLQISPLELQFLQDGFASSATVVPSAD